MSDKPYDIILPKSADSYLEVLDYKKSVADPLLKVLKNRVDKQIMDTYEEYFKNYKPLIYMDPPEKTPMELLNSSTSTIGKESTCTMASILAAKEELEARNQQFLVETLSQYDQAFGISYDNDKIDFGIIKDRYGSPGNYQLSVDVFIKLFCEITSTLIMKQLGLKIFTQAVKDELYDEIYKVIKKYEVEKP